jgi:quercetin dioxygenase-like cupin family protein
MPFIDVSSLETSERLPGWKGRSFNTANMTFAHYTIAEGAAIHEHCHSNEEVWTVIEGELLVTIGGDSITAGPGCVAIVPSYTAHSVRAVTAARAIVTDSPVRVEPGVGRRGVVRIDFDTPTPLHRASEIQIPFLLRNWGNAQVAIKRIETEANVAGELPPPVTTLIPTGELPTRFVLDADETRAETVSYSGPMPDPEHLRTGEQVFYVKGVILYDDDFGSRQHSTFCRVYDVNAFDGGGGFVSPNKPGYNYGS